METKMYTTLLNAITDALEDLDAVSACMVRDQRETEAMFISMNSNREN